MAASSVASARRRAASGSRPSPGRTSGSRPGRRRAGADRRVERPCGRRRGVEDGRVGEQRVSSSAARRTSSVSTRGASIGKMTCVSEPRSSTTLTVTSRRGKAGPANAASWKDSGRIPRTTFRSRLGSLIRGEAGIRGRRTRRPRGRAWPDEVHRGRADERGDEERGGTAVERLRRVHLLDPPVAHDGDSLAERHRLDLVVRDVHGRRAEASVQARELRAHVHAQLRVEVRERLVHQECERLAHDRAAHRHPLALATGEGRRPPVEQVVEPQSRATRSTRSATSAFEDLRTLSP